MTHEAKLARLRSIPVFHSPAISSRGYGTFIPKVAESTNNLAYSKKKIADQLCKTDPHRAHRVYIESVLIYIDVYLEDEHRSNSISVGGWRSLARYIKELKSMVRDKEGMLFSIYEFILFNIKFHSLPGECLSAGGDGEKMGGVLKECSELRGFFERSKINPFCILRLKDVKGFVEGKIAEMDALREKDLE